MALVVSCVVHKARTQKYILKKLFFHSVYTINVCIPTNVILLIYNILLPFVLQPHKSCYKDVCCIYAVSPVVTKYINLKTHHVFSMIHWVKKKYMYSMFIMAVCSKNNTTQMCKSLYYPWQNNYDTNCLVGAATTSEQEEAIESMKKKKIRAHSHF